MHNVSHIMTHNRAIGSHGPMSLGSEVLVRDGVGKLYLCWCAWTLAQWYQCERLEVGDNRMRLGERLFQRLCATTKGRGFGREKGRATPDMAAGILAIINDEIFQELTEDLETPTLSEIERRLDRKIGQGDRNPQTALELITREHVKWQTWMRLNGIRLTAPFSRVFFSADQEPTIRTFKNRETTARIFWGSKNSIERTCRTRYEVDPSLERFEDFDGASAELASPIPRQMLLWWGRVLGFGPIVDRWADAEQAAEAAHNLPELQANAWLAFCGADNAPPFRGTDRGTFAAALQDLIDGEPVAMIQSERRTGIVEVPTNKDVKSGSGWVDAPISRRTPTRSRNDSPAAHLPITMNAFNRDDGISMRIDTRDDGRVVLDELIYRFPQDETAEAERVCLTALEIEWDWRQSTLVSVDPQWSDSRTRRDAVQADNPDVSIRNTQHDSARFRLEFADRLPKIALTPYQEESVRRLVMPKAIITPAAGTLHKFAVSARKQDLCIAHRDDSGRFRVLERSVENLVSQAEALKRAVVIALVEVDRGFPNDNSRKELGAREAEALPTSSRGNTPPSETRT